MTATVYLLVAGVGWAAALRRPQPSAIPQPQGPMGLTMLQCGNLIYADNKSSVCFADKFLTDLARATNLRVAQHFCPVKLSADTLFDFPFCVMSGNESFTLTQQERDNLTR